MRVKEATLKYHYFEWDLESDSKQDVSFAGSCITVANFSIYSHQHVIKRLYLGLSLFRHELDVPSERKEFYK